ncbi:MAG: hypothetical protein QOE90_964 [Thermoplasmata archaeon]|jgi:hypothetical protein|nr:hypothetical protein [Thermoplasmata archaeon]
MRKILLPLIAIGFLLLSALPASAHVTQTQGAYSVKVGWGDEPAASGARNHVTVQVWKTDTGEGVSGLADTLNVTVTHGGQTKTLALAESDEDPGNYSAPLMPTQEGLYTVHVGGKLDASTPISQDFAIEPAENGSDAAFPSSGDLATQVQDLQTRVAALEAKAKTTSSTPATVVSSTPASATKGAPAVELGLVVLGLGAVAVALARKR